MGRGFQKICRHGRKSVIPWVQDPRHDTGSSGAVCRVLAIHAEGLLSAYSLKLRIWIDFRSLVGG